MAHKKLTPKQRKLYNDWIAALESGKYRQTREVLCRRENKNRKYCCLGVLCNLADPTAWVKDTFEPNTLAFGEEGISDRPPLELTNSLGVYPKDVDNLVELNDEHEFTFKEIATRLRKRDFSTPETEDFCE